MKPGNVDFQKLLRDTIRGTLMEWDHIPMPIGGPLSSDDAGDELIDPLTAEEWKAYAELVRDVKAEAIAAGETRASVIKGIDDVIAECDAFSAEED